MAMMPQDLLAKKDLTRRFVITLSEGSDPRVVAGGLAARDAGLADVILVGDADAVRAELAALGGKEGDGVSVHDPKTSDLTPAVAAEYLKLREHRGVDAAKAQELAETALVYAAMLVRLGHADGTVGGAVNATADVVRTAIQVIGMAPDASMVSSFFLMFPPVAASAGARAMVYADCGLVIDPSPEDLGQIAIASAASYTALMQDTPRVAMLSFSTKGSARHAHVTKVATAVEHLSEIAPDLAVDGELQFDTAFVPDIAERKAPESNVAGQANVMIFPDLDAGNIAYKITQRVAGYAAIGPILQGLAGPANDLSRGCSAADVTELIAVTALQALALSKEA